MYYHLNQCYRNNLSIQKPMEIVDITTPAYNSKLGRYFIAQTAELSLGNGYYAWGGLINPYNSGVNLFFDIFTITNLSVNNILSEIWLNAKEPNYAEVSSVVTSSNQTIVPPPNPMVIMKYRDNLQDDLDTGNHIFDRIVSKESTLVSDSHKGSIIIGPGGSVSVLLKPLTREPAKGIIVLTWWEEKIKPLCPYDIPEVYYER